MFLFYPLNINKDRSFYFLMLLAGEFLWGMEKNKTGDLGLSLETAHILFLIPNPKKYFTLDVKI